jgi:predicted DNA binding protein
MYEATFRIPDAGAYAATTAGSDARIELWCNDHCDLLHVTTGGDDDAAETVATRVESLVGIQDRLETTEELVVVTADCLKSHDTSHVETYLARHGCLLLPPLRYARGAKFCRVLALDPAALSACYRDLVDDGYRVDVESKREISSVGQDTPLLTLDDALPTLTERQREVLQTAFRQGYYEIPRQTTTEAIASSVGIERRTAEEHLRRAENKLIAGLIEYL